MPKACLLRCEAPEQAGMPTASDLRRKTSDVSLLIPPTPWTLTTPDRILLGTGRTLWPPSLLSHQEPSADNLRPRDSTLNRRNPRQLHKSHFCYTRGGGTPMSKSYDAIVVGARVAGSPTAMLLARKGYKILLVDRATFPSDTVSSHIIHPPGVAALARWGLLDRLTKTGCPPIGTYMFDFGPVTVSGAPGTKESPVAYCPRRTVLDKLLLDAAAEAGAEVREGFAGEGPCPPG